MANNKSGYSRRPFSGSELVTIRHNYLFMTNAELALECGGRNPQTIQNLLKQWKLRRPVGNRGKSYNRNRLVEHV